MRPWDTIIPEHERQLYEAAGFGSRSGFGKHPALLIVDVQYRTVGTSPMPPAEALREFKTSCGEVGWAAVGNIAKLLSLFRARKWPVIYPCVAPKDLHDRGRLAEKSPGIMTISGRGYEIVEMVKPAAGDLLVAKRHPSAFFGTSLVSDLVNKGVDTLIVTGCSTSGCVRATVVDGFSYNFHIGVPIDAVFDRSQASHLVNLFDMASKYADVDTTQDMIGVLGKI